MKEALTQSVTLNFSSVPERRGQIEAAVPLASTTDLQSLDTRVTTLESDPISRAKLRFVS